MGRRAHAALGLGVAFGGALALVASAPAAAPRPITGRLDKPGYTVMALAANGTARSVVAKHGSFSVHPPADRVTLQLRAPNGLYAGPIVVASEERGKQVIEGVRPGASLGEIHIDASKGYARVVKRLAARWVDTSRWARAQKGVPIGNGRNFGFVRSSRPRRPPPGDLDADGVPDVLSVAMCGNLILNVFDRSGCDSRAKQAQASVPAIVFGNPILDLDLQDTVNANAGLTDAQIAAALPKFGGLTVGITGIQADPGTQVELDCGNPDTGLVYCRQNGSSGTVETIRFGPFPGASEGAPYPSCCLAPDGFGVLTRVVPPGGVPIYYVPLLHHATSAQIGTGDLLTVHATIGGVAQQFSSTLQFVFQTVPAVASYSDGQGNAATINYPVAAPDPMTGMGGGPGTRGNPLPVKAGPDGHVLLTLTFWKPQRPPIANEGPGWIDLGHALYGADISDVGLQCPADAYLAYPGLTLMSLPFRGAPGLLDSSDDQPASPADKLSFTLDLTQCLAAGGLALNPGDERGIDLEANPAAAIPGGKPPTAVTHIFFKRQ